MALASGSKLGPYEILAPLGAGGMGEVYKARDPRLGREVAIKVLPVDRLSDDKTRRRFLQEARAASSLNHPNIVTIHEVAAKGGAPRRLTMGPGDEVVPSFSRDGRFVYFSTDRTGSRDFWRIPATGGTEERITTGAATYRALESIDGRALYYARDDRLYEHSLATGVVRQLTKNCVHGGIFDVAADGIYYAECDEDMKPRLHHLDPKTGRDRVLGVADGLGFSLAVSPDGRTILFTKIVGFGNDLMMIDNFR